MTGCSTMARLPAPGRRVLLAVLALTRVVSVVLGAPSAADKEATGTFRLMKHLAEQVTPRYEKSTRSKCMASGWSAGSARRRGTLATYHQDNPRVVPGGVVYRMTYTFAGTVGYARRRDGLGKYAIEFAPPSAWRAAGPAGLARARWDVNVSVWMDDACHEAVKDRMGGRSLQDYVGRLWFDAGQAYEAASRNRRLAVLDCARAWFRPDLANVLGDGSLFVVPEWDDGADTVSPFTLNYLVVPATQTTLTVRALPEEPQDAVLQFDCPGLSVPVIPPTIALPESGQWSTTAHGRSGGTEHVWRGNLISFRHLFDRLIPASDAALSLVSGDHRRVLLETSRAASGRDVLLFGRPRLPKPAPRPVPPEELPGLANVKSVEFVLRTLVGVRPYVAFLSVTLYGERRGGDSVRLSSLSADLLPVERTTNVFAGAPECVEWLRGQDRVYAACEGYWPVAGRPTAADPRVLQFRLAPSVVDLERAKVGDRSVKGFRSRYEFNEQTASQPVAFRRLKTNLRWLDRYQLNGIGVSGARWGSAFSWRPAALRHLVRYGRRRGGMDALIRVQLDDELVPLSEVGTTEVE